MVNVWADQLEIKYPGHDLKVLEVLMNGQFVRIWGRIMQNLPNVGNFSIHLFKDKLVGDFNTDRVNDQLGKLGVRSTEVQWENLPDRVVRTQYKKLWQIGGYYMINRGIMYGRLFE